MTFHVMSRITEEAMYYECNHYWRAKVKSIAHSGCVSVASIIQNETRMRPIILPSVAFRAVQYVSTLSYKRHDFVKTLLNTECVFQFSLQFLKL
jgi:hypothetical protein